MKNLISLFILVSLSLGINGQNDGYSKAMKEGMQLLQNATAKEQYLDAANHFERITQVETNQWLPAYHASFANAIAASMQGTAETMESQLDKAQSLLDRASEVKKDHSELSALQGFIYMMRIAVDPAVRGQQYSGMSGASIQKAMSLDPNNPRAMYLLAQLTQGTAQFFGSDSAEACQMNQKAIQLFLANSAQAGENEFQPSWGLNMAEAFKETCQN